MNNTTLIILTIATVLGSQVNATRVRYCDGTANPDTEKVNITNCDEPPCKLVKDDIVIISQKFKPNHNINMLTYNVWWTDTSMKSWSRLPELFDKEACEMIPPVDYDSRPSCSLEKDTEYMYKYHLFVKPHYARPSIVRWALQERGNNIACFMVEFTD